ncbi:MAG: hypothetical protein GY894_09050 [Planctomycetes bacterium]|jgi:hypothetical protein|nr:hypothetical protein [Planctomycetota bacterium]MCP4839490.1 hypothetical protein [Planctomycetota bacterium]
MQLRIISVLSVTAAMLSSCAYLDYARHWAGDFVASCDVRRIGGNAGHLSMPVATKLCTSDPFVHTSLWMSDLKFSELASGEIDSGQILHVEMLFPPMPGETPIDSDATNLSIRYILISNGEVGIYEGGGFGYPIGGHESGNMSLRVEPSGLVLTEATEGFVDLLSPARLTAVFTGICNDSQGHRFADGVDQFVTNAFGRTMYVRAGDNQVRS